MPFKINENSLLSYKFDENKMSIEDIENIKKNSKKSPDLSKLNMTSLWKTLAYLIEYTSISKEKMQGKEIYVLDDFENELFHGEGKYFFKIVQNPS